MSGRGASGTRVAGLLLAALVAIAAGSTGEPPLRDADVVRMVAAGDPVETIVARIRSARVEFDLSPEMVDELRIAGVPSLVIDVMIARQAEIDREAVAQTGTEPGAEAEPSESAVTTPPAPNLRLRLERRKSSDDDEGPETLVYPAVLADQDLAAAHGLGLDRQTWAVSDLGVFLACRTSDHVPDQWRAKSPLGRDFVNAPRHRLLQLAAAARRVEAKDRLGKILQRLGMSTRDVRTGFLELEPPDELTADVEPGVEHDLVLGIAVEVDHRWLVVALVEGTFLAPADGPLEIEGAVWSRARRRGFDLGARFGGTGRAGS